MDEHQKSTDQLPTEELFEVFLEFTFAAQRRGSRLLELHAPELTMGAYLSQPNTEKHSEDGDGPGGLR